MSRELLIGCGSRRNKDIGLFDGDSFGEDLVALDLNIEHKPTIVSDLSKASLPFANNSFDQIHAYEILEHLGSQGDYKFFFKEFSEYWRILKKDGLFFASVPNFDSIWALGDPSHTRVINRGTLIFLSQESYKQQVGVTKMSDFRHIYKADFRTIFKQEREDGFYFILQAIKGRLNG